MAAITRGVARVAFSTSAAPAAGKVERVAVIGGGVAGLQTAKALLARGIQPIVFEKDREIGGVWRSNYDSFGLQVPKQLYEFPDFPFTSAAEGEFASGEKVQAYIRDYARHHGLDSPSLLKLGTAVDSLAPRTDGKPGWIVKTRRTADSAGAAAAAAEEVAVDFAVVATGLYGSPTLPHFQGREGFGGSIVHSTAFTDASTAKGKTVVVVGAGKSAVDCALAAARAGASSSTLLYRQAHWGTPRKLAGLIPFQYVFLSRLGQALVSWYKGAHPTAPASVHAAHSALKGVMGPVFRIVEALFAFQLGHRGDFLPSKDVVADFYGGAQVLGSEFKDALAAGSVSAVRGSVERLTPTGIVLSGSGGKEIPADIIVCGTGFARDYSRLLPADVHAKLDVAPDGLWLWRQTLPIGVPGLAFVGSEVATISNIATFGLQAEWLARLLSGQMAAPPVSEQEAAVAKHKAWARGWMPESNARAALQLLHQIHYNDALLKDMGLPHRRKGANVLAELFAPYHPRDYADVFQPLPAAAGGNAAQASKGV